MALKYRERTREAKPNKQSTHFVVFFFARKKELVEHFVQAREAHVRFVVNLRGLFCFDLQISANLKDSSLFLQGILDTSTNFFE
jgi:hypothetical protein